MSTPMTVLVVEVIVILLMLVALLLFFRWQKIKVKASAMEALVDNVEAQEKIRKQLLLQHLQAGYALNDEKAAFLVEQISEAEKQFLQLFIQQQVEQTSIADFYEILCKLLDQYLKHIPTLDSSDLYSKESAFGSNKENDNKGEGKASSQGDDIDLRLNEPVIDEAVPEWDDAFSESGDDMDDEISIETATENKAEIDESLPSDNEAPEPDWGDAFSESGDKMDEGAAEEAGIAKEVEAEENADYDESEPDWGDAFSESGDKMDSDTATQAGIEQETETEENSSSDEAEPDWGEAFSESGDKMDDSVKEGFDAETSSEVSAESEPDQAIKSDSSEEDKKK